MKINTKIGKYTYLGPAYYEANGKKITKHYFRCDCGNLKWLYPANVLKSRNPQCIDCKNNELSSVPDMIGKKFNQLTVLSFGYSNGKVKFYTCRCDCGSYRVCDGSSLRLGRVKRCKQCKKILHSKHGLKGTTEWVIWQGIKQRCLNPQNRAYKNYGGRGITICDKWLDFQSFLIDMGFRPKGMQIDRIDNNKGYYKDNCHWVTPKQNSNNRRVRSESRDKDSPQ